MPDPFIPVDKLTDLERELAALRQRVETIEGAFGVERPRPMPVTARPDASVLLARSLCRMGTTKKS